ncbi:MAG: aminopeptidase [Defluviitaleaceae bacterium]|nr:aminopeptidase [Defluviitaleaceae bacterium]MCL2239481.1 aminopeptidase [Defluviitaleaceae bacterium]
MDNAKMKKYAELLVRSGGNVQPGQIVVIGCGVDDAWFARMVQECAYDAGAREVIMDWSDDISTRNKFLRADGQVFDEFPQWKIDWYKHYDDRGAVYLRISGSDPDYLAGVDPDRLRRFSKVSGIATKAHSALAMSNAVRWSVIAIPTPKWAMKVFPGLPEAQAMEKLWAAILKGARADGTDPQADWEAHKNNFTQRVDYLNGQNFDALRITTGLGTDITIGLAKNHVWVGGGDLGKDGVPFFPNLPTEEIFTMPDRMRAEGRVVASMPLSRQGNLIEGFEMTFKDGLVESFKAEKNEQTLADIFVMDEGAKRLGEVALVANSSPIGQMGTLFYNTLFDENAAAHLALGKAYPNNMQGGDEMTTEERVAAGGNDSLVHVDFMFGTADMKVVGIAADGSETVFFDNGEFI